VRDEGYLREISLQVGETISKINAEAVIDRLVFGVGTDLITGGDQASLGGVYKLVAVSESAPAEENGWEPRVKLSAQPEKMTNPGMKRVTRLLRNGFIVADIIGLPDERVEPGAKVVGINPRNPSQHTVYENFDAVASLHVPIFEDGRLLYTPPLLPDVKAHARQQIHTIRLESRRLENPHTLKVSLSQAYWRFKQGIIEDARMHIP
jgi:nicotinate phosphoribosyltransferase